MRLPPSLGGLPQSSSSLSCVRGCEWRRRDPWRRLVRMRHFGAARSAGTNVATFPRKQSARSQLTCPREAPDVIIWDELWLQQMNKTPLSSKPPVITYVATASHLCLSIRLDGQSQRLP